MDISVEELSSVDKEVIIKANRDDLAPKFDKAYKRYRGQIQMPGFRPGKIPLSLIRKRFGSEIEMEEINKYVQEVFEKEVIPEHNPVGETEMVDLQWEDDRLEVKFKIGARPEFELIELSEIEVDQMVHDVTDEEVEEEIERTLERQGDWEEVDGEIEEEHRVVVDAQSLDEEGEPIEGELDEDQTLNLKDESAEEFRNALVGKKAGDVVEMEVGEGDEKDRFRLTVKKVEKPNKVELTDEFAKEQSNGEAKNTDEFRSYLKSRMQDYYDKSSDDLFRQDMMTALTEAHDFEIPAVFESQILNSYVEYLKQQTGGQLPPDFDEEDYKSRMKDQALQEGKWSFISEKLQEKFDDIEIKPEDIDDYIGVEAARYGVSVDQMKQFFAQDPGQLESLRTNIREAKVFDKLKEVVTINEISKDDYQEKRKKEEEENEEKEN